MVAAAAVESRGFFGSFKRTAACEVELLLLWECVLEREREKESGDHVSVSSFSSYRAYYAVVISHNITFACSSAS